MLVTGGNKGIGLAIVERMINEGMSVVVSSRTADDVQAVTDRLGDNAIGIPCDVADPEACSRLVEETVERFGRLDILVNNAAAGIMKPPSATTNADRSFLLERNVTAPAAGHGVAVSAFFDVESPCSAAAASPAPKAEAPASPAPLAERQPEAGKGGAHLLVAKSRGRCHDTITPRGTESHGRVPEIRRPARPPTGSVRAACHL